MKKVFLNTYILVTLFLLNSSAFSILYEDGGTHTIDYRIKYFETVYIDQNVRDAQTHVILASGGIADNDVWCFGKSKFTSEGGYLRNTLRLLDNSTGILQEGIIGDSYLTQNSTLEINGGEIQDDIILFDNAQVVVNGGEIGFEPSTGYKRGIQATENSLVTVNGGSIKGLLAGHRDNGPYDTSTIQVVGNGFKLNGSNINAGQYYASDFTPDSLGYIGTLSGTLASGETINSEIYIYDGSCLHLVPEPATFSLFTLGAMLAVRKGKSRE
mgnify:CR=1 FL=1